MKKKSLALALALVMLLGALSACGKTEPEEIGGVPCYVFDLLDRNRTYTGYSFAVARDLSRFYEIEQVNGQWLLQARPRSAL